MLQALSNKTQTVFMTEVHERLKQARENAGYVTAREFADKNGIPRSTYTVHENGQRKISPTKAEEYAAILKVSPHWLIFGSEPTALKVVSDNEFEAIEADIELIHIVGAVEAGVWAEAVEWNEDDRRPLASYKDDRYPNTRKFALEVRGNSMNELYRPGDILRCVHMMDIGDKIEDGKRYIVYRKNPAGEIEATVKELRIHEDGTKWLWPRSSDPRHQAPIELNGNEGDEITLHARVIGSSSVE